ncbi:S8 family serine peptidase, partial [Microbulbifer halophilus]
LLGRAAPPPPPAPPARQTQAAEQAPEPKAQNYEAGEMLLVSADMAAAQAAARQLQAYQLRVKSRQRLANLGLVVSVFRLPAGSSAPELVARLRTELSDLQLDTNQRYRALNARRRYAHRLIAWPEPLGSCDRDFRIGMLDTAVADRHPALANTALERRNFARGEAAPAVHGTAVASLLIGEPGSPAPGLLPGSRLFAAEVFRQRGDIADTTADTLLDALDWLAGRDVQVVNLSLGGERNRVFELALERLLERDIQLVAAAGNGGPDAPPVFPAAQPGVIAVTAVDALERLYPDANRGDYIDLAAPGVDIWAADGEARGRYHTGTSFAAPFVTAALLLAQQRDVDLTRAVKDLGADGRDDRFGWGLVQVAAGCR